MAKKPTAAKRAKPRPTAGAKKAPPRAGKPAPEPSAPKANSVRVIATIKSVDDLHQLPQLAKKLKDEGMKVDEVLPLSGAITGSCPADQIAALNNKVPGVVVERGLTMSPS